MRPAIQMFPPYMQSHYTYRLTESYDNKTSLVQKSVGRHRDEIMAAVLFEQIPMGNSEQKHTSTEVGFYTSDDVDSCQAIESAHQLSVSFFTLHSTFLLQGLQELLHRHGAAEGGVRGHSTDKST